MREYYFVSCIIRISRKMDCIFIYFWGVYFTFTDTVFRLIALTGSLSYAGIISGLVGGMYWKRANACGVYVAFAASAIPPIVSLIYPEINPTNAGLLSFVLAPLGLVIGSLSFQSNHSIFSRIREE